MTTQVEYRGQLMSIDEGYHALEKAFAKIESDKARIQREITELIDQHLAAGVHCDVVLSAVINALQAFRG